MIREAWVMFTIVALLFTGCAGEVVLPVQVEGEVPAWVEDGLALSEVVFEIGIEATDRDAPIVLALVPGVEGEGDDCAIALHESTAGATTLCRRVALIDPDCDDEAVVAHELGHLLQLPHDADPANAMFPKPPGLELRPAQRRRAEMSAAYLQECFEAG